LVLTIARIHGHMLLQMLFRQAFLMTLVHITCKMALEIIIIIIILLETGKSDNTRGSEKKLEFMFSELHRVKAICRA